MGEYHWIYDVAFPVASLVLGLVIRNTGLKIKNAILEIGGRIDVHVAECDLIRKEVDRRLQRLENA